jgi:hypothetical protein
MTDRAASPERKIADVHVCDDERSTRSRNNAAHLTGRLFAKLKGTVG